MINITRKRWANVDLEITGTVYAFGSSIIDLCQNVFWRAKFRKTKAGVKLNTLYDIKKKKKNKSFRDTTENQCRNYIQFGCTHLKLTYD